MQKWYLLLLVVPVGIAMGMLAVFANSVSIKWVGIIILVLALPSVIFLVNDIKKLLLIIFVIDLPFGFDIAIQNQGWHMGGPTGFMISLMTIALVVGYALWIIEKYRPVKFLGKVAVPALLYLLTSALSFLHSANWQLSAFGLFLKMQVFLMYFYLVNQISSKDRIRLITSVLALALLFESTIMILQYLTDFSLDLGGLITSSAIPVGSGGMGVTGRRVSGTLGSPSAAALFLNLALTIVYGAYLSGSLIDKRLALLSLFFGVTALIATSSRGGWVSFFAALLFIQGYAMRTTVGRERASIFLVGVTLFTMIFGQQIYQRIITVSKDNSREQMATMAYNIIEDYPLGIGENTYDLYMGDKYAHPALIGGIYHRPPHNKYLILWAELGPQGLIAYLAVLLGVLWQSWWLLSRIDLNTDIMLFGAGCMGSFITFLIHSWSETFTARPQVQLFWFIIALLSATGELFIQTRNEAVIVKD